jgi:hypothetical protein
MFQNGSRKSGDPECVNTPDRLTTTPPVER